MSDPLLLLDGHPDAEPRRFVHALAGAYETGARAAGRPVERLDLHRLALPPLRSEAEWKGPPDPSIAQRVEEAQQAVERARHLVLLYPLWMGEMPALVKAFFEQVMRPGFATPGSPEDGGVLARRLKGRSARIVVTMGMPALAYRWWFRAHSLKSLERNILGLCGIGPIRQTLIGSVASLDDAKRRAWLERLQALGAEGR